MDCSILNEIIIGRVEPHIYAFSTNTVPNYLKVGDTYRPVGIRLKEWTARYPTLKSEFEVEAKIGEVFFRDYAVHAFLENEKKKTRLRREDLPAEIYYSKEFFKDTSVDDIQEAICDIKRDYDDKTQKYSFYNVETLRPEAVVYARTDSYPLRPNQKATVAAFKKAVENGRHNLLMYAVMRFGKSFTSMCCAVAIKAKLVVVVSAKADVMTEWKKTVESHTKFAEYDFVSAENLSRDYHVITKKLSSGRKVVVFLTLQDLQGDKIKDRHQEVFGQEIDLLLVDETHFGARTEKYGEVLKNVKYVSDVKYKKDNDDFVEASEADETIKTLKAKTTIHLSGTPYRILMGSEFTKDDIIAFCQFADIVSEQQKWDKEHVLDDDCKEWDNPYYGFPQMVRFAFVPNESSRKKLEDLKKSGMTYAFSGLFRPRSKKKVSDGSHKQFVYEKEICDLFAVIDGSKDDDRLLGFLDFDNIKRGNMCRHIVIVLPYRASCDALEALLKANVDNFKNLCDYEIVNIAGVDDQNKYKTATDVKRTIAEFEAQGKKTITLTVNRMLTGSTVPEWDTMLYFKDTASPQEYDQAIFRLQNQYIKTYVDKDGHTIKYNMKPQTLLVDFDPNRMFTMQESKSKIYNVNVEKGGNSKLKSRIEKELEISPIITVNADRIVKATATDILEAISNYQKDKGIMEEASDLPVDLSILNDDRVRAVIERENEIGAKQGLSTTAYTREDGDDDAGDIAVPGSRQRAQGRESGDGAGGLDDNSVSADEQDMQARSLSKKIQSYYTRILLFAFITKDKVISLSDILDKIETGENPRIAENLGLNKDVLALVNKNTNKFVLSDLDYKIQNLNTLSQDEDMSPDQRVSVALSKFGKFGDAIVITPSKTCADMVDLLPDDLFRHLSETKGKILDIAGTAGEYAVALCNKMRALGIDNDVIVNSIYTIPKSPICYELVRKLYEMLGLNIQNIAKEFVATNLLDIKDGKDIDYAKITALLTQNKSFATIKLTDTPDQGDNNMIKFDAVVGNPPYQEGIENTSDSPVYHLFLETAFKISSIVSMITPARFLFNAGKTPKSWNEKVLNDDHFKVVLYSPKSTDFFPNVDIKGGVAVTLRDSSQNFGKLGIFLQYQELNTILTKVRNLNECSLSNQVYSPESYKFSDVLHKENPEIAKKLSKGHLYDITSNIFGKIPEIFSNCPSNINNVGLYGRKNNERVVMWTKRQYLEPHDNLDHYKVFIPKSNGTGAIGEVLSTPIIGEPGIGHTQTFISIGKLDSIFEAKALLQYIKTKFLRCMLGVLKVTQDNKKAVWEYVPLQDFTENSDIDWNKSIPEIDRQLYKKYNLTDEEIAFIESKIKPME